MHLHLFYINYIRCYSQRRNKNIRDIGCFNFKSSCAVARMAADTFIRNNISVDCKQNFLFFVKNKAHYAE